MDTCVQSGINLINNINLKSIAVVLRSIYIEINHLCQQPRLGTNENGYPIRNVCDTPTLATDTGHSTAPVLATQRLAGGAGIVLAATLVGTSSVIKISTGTTV